MAADERASQGDQEEAVGLGRAGRTEVGMGQVS